MSMLILPAKMETQSVCRGRDAIRRMTNELSELVDKGKEPTRIEISTAVADDLRAFFEYAYDVFDGVLPKEYCGVPIEHVPGAGDLRIECR